MAISVHRFPIVKQNHPINGGEGPKVNRVRNPLKEQVCCFRTNAPLVKICISFLNLNVQGYDENDREQVEKGLSSTAIKELDLDMAKLARWPLCLNNSRFCVFRQHF